MTAEWTIQGRGDRCATTGAEFKDGESFYTLLYEENEGFRREDLSESAFQARAEDAPQPFSFWRSKFELPPPGAPEPLGKQTAEDLLRRYMVEDSTQHTNARYILALMLERKRMIKEVEVKTADNGDLIRIYEHAKTGEVFIIPDPQLKLSQLAQVQAQVAQSLQWGGGETNAAETPGATGAGIETATSDEKAGGAERATVRESESTAAN